jgi:hypothetical protein
LQFKKPMGIALLISDISRKSSSVIDSSHWSNKPTFMLTKYNNADHISEEVFNSLNNQIKMCVGQILYKPSVKMYYWNQSV